MTSLTKVSGVLYRLKKYMSMDTLRMVHHALVKSKLQYGIILWGSANKSSLNRLNKLDNKTIRSVTGLPYETSINHLYSLFKSSLKESLQSGMSLAWICCA